MPPPDGIANGHVFATQEDIDRIHRRIEGLDGQIPPLRTDIFDILTVNRDTAARVSNLADRTFNVETAVKEGFAAVNLKIDAMIQLVTNKRGTRAPRRPKKR